MGEGIWADWASFSGKGPAEIWASALWFGRKLAGSEKWDQFRSGGHESDEFYVRPISFKIRMHCFNKCANQL